MQGHYNCAPVARRYFGRDLTNIETMPSQKMMIEEVKIPYVNIDIQKREKQRQNVYRPATSQIASFKRNSSKYEQLENRLHHELPYVHSLISDKDTYQEVHPQKGDCYSVYKDEQYYRKIENEGDAITENKRQGNNEHKNYRMDAEYLHSPIPRKQDEHQYPTMVIEVDNLYGYQKQMNFPGSNFLEINNLPLNYIWSHLIFTKVCAQ